VRDLGLSRTPGFGHRIARGALLAGFRPAAPGAAGRPTKGPVRFGPAPGRVGKKGVPTRCRRAAGQLQPVVAPQFMHL